LIRALVGALVFLSLAAASSGAHAQTVLIAGRVVADETGTPLPHARIVIYNDATPLPALLTDAEGRFSSTLPATGRYRLAATKAGYALTNVTRLTADGPAGIEVRMPRSASISGRVFDTYGEAIARIAVALESADPRNAQAPLKVVTTDDLGEYRIGGLAAGSYLVTVTQLAIDPSWNVNRVRMFFPGVAAAGDATPLVLAAGDQKSGVDFSGVTTETSLGDLGVQLIQQPNVRITGGIQLTPPDVPQGTATIRGRVTRPDGVAVARARVITNAPRPMGGGRINVQSMSVMTDDDGRYELTGLFAGDYQIRVTKPGYTDTIYGQQPDAGAGARVSVADNQIKSQIDVVLPRHSAVAGQVFDDFGDPVEGATVGAWQIRFQGGRRNLVSANAGTRVTDDLGRYRLSGLAPGQYVISTSIGQVGTQVATVDISGFATTYYPGTTNPAEARLVTVPRSQDVTSIDVTLVALPTASIVGQRIGVDGQPMGGSIMLTPSQRSGAIVTPSTGARTWDDGRFEFPNVSPGEYVVQASAGKPAADREGEFAAQFVTVNGADVRDVFVQATPGSTISGRVVFDGDPPPDRRGLAIEPTSADPDRSPTRGNIARADVREDFTFFMQGIHGPRRITVPRVPAGWMLKSVTSGGVDVTDVALPFGNRDQSLTDVEVVLTNRLTELTGTAIDGRGQTATAFTVLVFPTDHDRWYPGSRFFRHVASESAGNFSVRGLPSGDYFVAAVSGLSVLRDGIDAWQDPEFLDSIALRGAHVTLTDGEKLSITPKLITP
jgi:protocatechuate 3,4-dioxygenase beta subunit